MPRSGELLQPAYENQTRASASLTEVDLPPTPNLKRRLKNGGKLFLRQVFEFGQRFGLDILPRHFYSEIPDIRLLRQDRTWRAPFSMEGINGDIDDQLSFLRDCTAPFKLELAKRELHQSSVRMNGSDEGYGKLEADVLYSFVRRHRPNTIIQVGCGVSTAVCLLAAQDERYSPRIICIEPYPTDYLKGAQRSGAIELLPNKVQDLEVNFFKQLSAGDLFFVDSSHTLGPGGEVSRIVLSILPTVARDVFVHFHDIWFPYDYCPHVLSSDLFFLHETPLLYAFLCMNREYSIAASLSQLFHEKKDELQQCLPGMRAAEFDDGVMTKPGDHPSSIYLRS